MNEYPGVVLASMLWYLGGLVTVAGLVAAIRPVRRLGLGTRRRALAAILAGAATSALALTGVTETRILAPAAAIDRYIPVYQFSERHEIAVAAPAALAWKAIFEVRPDEIRYFRTLIRIRRLGQTGPESILEPSPDRSLLDTALATTFRRLEEVPGREIVVATFVVAPASAASRTWTPELFAALEEPGFARAVMNFLVEPAGEQASVVRTETRVHATDAATRRSFTAYWRTIYPGSSLIRRSWLDAVRVRAEAAVRKGT